MKNTRQFVEKNSMLVKEFDRYVLEHPEITNKITDNALVVMQIKNDKEFNLWARKAALSVKEKNTPIVYITIFSIKPVRSRIEKLELECIV